MLHTEFCRYTKRNRNHGEVRNRKSAVYTILRPCKFVLRYFWREVPFNSHHTSGRRPYATYARAYQLRTVTNVVTQ